MSGFPFASEARSWIATGIPAPVEAVRSWTTAGAFELPLSLDGPLWQVYQPTWKPRQNVFVPKAEMVRSANERERTVPR